MPGLGFFFNFRPIRYHTQCPLLWQLAKKQIAASKTTRERQEDVMCDILVYLLRRLARFSIFFCSDVLQWGVGAYSSFEPIR